jgi:hypothetical protein
MDEPYEQLLREMSIALDRLSAKVPPAQRVSFAGGFVFRYVERTAHQAIVQKLARMITGLRAELLLLRNGLVQEQGVIERVLDDLREDVTFLVYGILHCELDSKWHKLFLSHFTKRNSINLKAPSIQLKSARWYHAKKFRRTSPILRA